MFQYKNKWEVDKGRFNAYDCLLGNIHGGTIFMKK